MWRLMDFLLSRMGYRCSVCGQHFCLRENEFIKRNNCSCWCCRLWRGFTHTLCLICLKMYYTFRIRFFSQSFFYIMYSFRASIGVEIQGHLDFWFPLRCCIYLKLCLKVKTTYTQTKSHCWSASPLRASLFLFTKKASFFLCAAVGLWNYQGTPVPWGKFPCSL